MAERERDEVRAGTALSGEEIAAEGGVELPDREAMSLVTGPQGLGSLPVLGGSSPPLPVGTQPPTVASEPVPPVLPG